MLSCALRAGILVLTVLAPVAAGAQDDEVRGLILLGLNVNDIPESAMASVPENAMVFGVVQWRGENPLNYDARSNALTVSKLFSAAAENNISVKAIRLDQDVIYASEAAIGSGNTLTPAGVTESEIPIEGLVVFGRRVPGDDQYPAGGGGGWTPPIVLGPKGGPGPNPLPWPGGGGGGWPPYPPNTEDAQDFAAMVSAISPQSAQVELLKLYNSLAEQNFIAERQ